MKNFKVYEMNDVDTVIAESKEQALEYMGEICGYGKENKATIEDMITDLEVDPRELTEEELNSQKTPLVDSDTFGLMTKDEQAKNLVTFAEYVKRANKGEVEAPLHLSTEW